MISIGLTGGIGSGKSTVAKIFQALGYPVFYADEVAKKCYDSPEIQEKVLALFGESILEEGKISFKKIGGIVFENPPLLAQLNQLIHPCVQQKFEFWKNLQNSRIIIKEAAILVESGAYKSCDYVVAVEAPQAIRVKRVQIRDHQTESQILQRIASQMSDEQRKTFAHYVINNHETFLSPQVLGIIQKIENEHFIN